MTAPFPTGFSLFAPSDVLYASETRAGTKLPLRLADAFSHLGQCHDIQFKGPNRMILGSRRRPSPFSLSPGGETNSLCEWYYNRKLDRSLGREHYQHILVSTGEWKCHRRTIARARRNLLSGSGIVHRGSRASKPEHARTFPLEPGHGRRGKS